MTDATFWDRVARRYAKSPIKDQAAYEYTLGRTQSYLSTTDRVLELGAGTASTALLLAPHVAHITASDISREMVAIGQEKAWDAGIRNIDVVQAAVGDPALGSRPFDAVLALNLIHLLPDAEGDLRKVADMVKPGGYFISKTPCLAGRWYLRPVIAVMRAFGKAPFVRMLSIRDLEAIVTQAGFEIIESGNFPAKAPSRYLVARKL